MDKREKQVKDRLMQAMISLTKEKEWTKITVTDLINRAGVARASFYRNFKATPLGDRLTALHAIFRQIFRHFRQNLLEIRQYSCVDFVNLTKNYARNLTRNLCAVLP